MNLKQLKTPGIKICPVLFAILSFWSFSFSTHNHDAWHLLMSNKPLEAREAFQAAIADKNIDAAKDAYIGLAFTNEFLGEETEASRSFFKGCMLKYDPVEAYNGIHFRMAFCRLAESYSLKEGYKFFKSALKKPGMFNGSFSDELVERYMADGKIKDAWKIASQMGVIRNWKCIGPFENISNSGFNVSFPPEKELDFSKTYKGKDGNDVSWFPITVGDPRGWLFMNQHTTTFNSVYYFYTTIESPSEQSVRLAFGASGTFKIFLNNQTVIADSVFRNTGIDIYMQTVKLHRGTNSLLVKVGHEGRQNLRAPAMFNFILRILDDDYSPVRKLRYSLDPVAVKNGNSVIKDLRPMPVVDSAAAYLQRKLDKNPDDLGSALLKVMLYNVTEMTDSAQIFCASYLKSYPNSSIWHSCYAEALQRANKMNQMQVELRKAFQLCGLNYRAWAYELNLLREAGNPQKILDFINASNPLMQNTAMAHVLKMSAYAILENQTGFFNELSILEDNFPLDNYAVSVLVPIYSKLGRTSQAEKIIRNYLEHDHTHAEFYGQLVSLANQKGELEKGLSVIREWQKYTPDNVSSSYSAAYMLYADKQYDRALEHVNRALELLPAWAAALNLKGSILTSMGETEKAISVYKETIARTNDDFLAWENLRLLQKQPSLDSLVPLPSIESLIKQSGGWDMKNGESGAILSYITDLFFYPSHCSRERRFLVVYLPNQKAVDQWKEYRVGYNEYYQTGYITRAFSYAPDGTETPADMENGYVVFKSLKPGDYILLEYSIRNYYTGKMAKHVFGTESFQIAYPIYNHQLRFITPVNDTIPFRISGDSLEVSSSINGDYRITSFTRQSGSADKAETFVADDWEGKRQVSYSTLPDWNYVSVWYNELSRGKAGNSIELTHLADSLFTGIDNSLERARRIHEYITTNIRYSYVPFRQSGWIPQSATDVLATRIGDCKDMSSLARYLLEAAGIRARLVLVNTEMRNGITNVPTSPDFNHCIVAFKIDDRQYYMDCTDDCLNFGYLPEMDQGAVALIVDDSTRNLITLPLDSSDNRYVKRITVSEVDTSLTLRVQTSTLRTGVKAAGIRRLYRYISADEQRQKMHSAVAEDYTQMTLDSLKFDDLSTSSDTLRYFYGFTAKNAAMRNGSTISMAIRFVDDVGSRDFPVEEKRSFPIDMSQSAYGIGNFCEEKTIKIPKNWRMLVKPTPVHLESPWGSYHLEFAFDNSVISITRNASFKFYSPVPVSQLDQFKAFMSKIAENDAMQLLFEVK